MLGLDLEWGLGPGLVLRLGLWFGWELILKMSLFKKIFERRKYLSFRKISGVENSWGLENFSGLKRFSGLNIFRVSQSVFSGLSVLFLAYAQGWIILK